MKKVVFVTGASSGLGKGVAEELVSLGFNVYGGFNKSKPPINSVKYIKIDITDNKSCLKAVNFIKKREKKIDVLINCAGISPAGETLDFTDEDFIRTLQINAIGPFRLIKYVAPLMEKRGGLIINVTSLNGLVSLPHSGIYSASKFALEALGFSLRQELAGKNINVVSVAPGAFLKEDQEISPLPKKIGVRERSFIIRTVMPFTPQKKVVDGIAKLVVNPNYSPRILIGPDVKIVYLISKVLPLSVVDRIIRFIWKKRGSLALRS